ncbi:benzoate/H(+) symporter BenE family transporter [Micromonospora sp. MW-13]|uniref:benzoate/H(+) symporter BenE family transporter n=1 Tax=Micromonospora sp. MW-13 TaxID=2094022 RepID=UPI001A9E7E6B|nr:benzoate/H(+) symporter BenE family transporter [Micromonospora sp. MW-13]
MSRGTSVLRDVSASAVVAGFLSALINFAGPFLITLEATRAAGLNEAQTASWVWALSIGNGVCSIAMSLFTHIPVIVAWSTPGAALLIASLGGFSFAEAVGAFLVASVAAAVVGYTGWFGWLLARVPGPVLKPRQSQTDPVSERTEIARPSSEDEASASALIQAPTFNLR